MSLTRHLVALAVVAATLCLLPTFGRQFADAADSDAGKLIVVKAEYGDLPDGKSLDVTDKVKTLVKDNSLNVTASNNNLGNPASGAANKLKVSYTIDGIYRSKTADEGKTLDISTRLVIRKAVYGAVPKGPSADVTDQVADMVQKNKLVVEASNDLFGDPAGGVVKKLRVDYTLDGVDKSLTVDENQTLSISAK